MSATALKQKKCRHCKDMFTPWASTQVACSPVCAIAVTNDRKAKRERKEHAQKKLTLKTRAQWLKEAQTAVNAFVRLRDEARPCVSCDKPNNGQHQRHASHYRSVGACSSLRFNTLNIHASCSTCNSVLSGNLIEYRIRLIKRLGVDCVEWLERQNEIVRYDIEYAKRVKRIFKKRTAIYRRLRNE